MDTAMTFASSLQNVASSRSTPAPRGEFSLGPVTVEELKSPTDTDHSHCSALHQIHTKSVYGMRAHQWLPPIASIRQLLTIKHPMTPVLFYWSAFLLCEILWRSRSALCNLKPHTYVRYYKSLYAEEYSAKTLINVSRGSVQTSWQTRATHQSTDADAVIFSLSRDQGT